MTSQSMVEGDRIVLKFEATYIYIYIYIYKTMWLNLFPLQLWFTISNRFHECMFRTWQKKKRTWQQLQLYICVYAAAAKSLQSCPTLCDPIACSPPGSSIPGILQARTLEWVAISSSNAWKWKVKVKLLSHIRLVETPWTAAYQAPPSMGFSRQEYWSGVPLPSPIYVYTHI